MFEKPDPKQSFPQLEEAILRYWKENKIFEKSVEKNKGRSEYVFYDGPPFATGLPHYGHILAGTLKDVIPRYQTMRGNYVPRRWGWDCHGLPVENLVEKELELGDKKAILAFGIDKFNEACRSSVLRYTKEWGKVVERMGRWVDFEDSYKTMSPGFMESIWWVFKTLWDKGLIYKGKKSMHVCPRCVTPLSNFEVGLGYKDVTDFSTTAQFKLEESPEKKKLFGDKPTYVLAWTTTTWTLPGNVLLAIEKKTEYVVFESTAKGHEKPVQYVMAKDCLMGYSETFPELEQGESFTSIKGKKLVGLEYEPLFDVSSFEEKERKKLWRIVPADFVTTESGTGVVHIAAGYGEDDMKLAQDLEVPIIQHLQMDGTFIKELGANFEKLNVVGETNKRKTDEAIAQMLKDKGYWLSSHTYRHSYPHCWRCDTPLLNYATDSWYVDIDKIKKKMLKNNDKINWVPEHLKHGRFGKWLESARDWAISRNRYWGTPLPIWEGDKGGLECLGSLADLRFRIPKRFTKLTFVRHGESEGNTVGLRQAVPPGTGLTKKGRKQAKEAGKSCKEIHKKEAFDRIIHSPLRRTKETAEIIAKELGSKISLVEDAHVQEIDFGKTEGKRDIEIKEDMQKRAQLSPEEHYKAKCGEIGESHEEVTKRAHKFVSKMIKEYPGESVLIVTHSDIIRLLLRDLNGDSLELLYSNGHYPMGEPKELYFDNETGMLVDLHKHFVDDMEYKHPETGETMRRIPEVLDCWFESGAMPYAQAHYPFENKERFEATFPANFIAEGLDQTRGWFYTLTVLASALFDKPAFQNVIVNGIVLAEDGQKMSKSKQNYPDPKIIFDRYGADAMRIYLMNSPVVKADDLRFSEKGVEEVIRNTMLPLWNAYSFLLTYAEIDKWRPKEQIYFIRHGETDANKADEIQGSMDLPLNDHGRDQIRELRKTTKHLPIDVIVSSDYLRAKQTAEMINADHEFEIEVHAGLREQSFGEYEGKVYHEFIQDVPKDLHPAFFVRKDPPKGESLKDFEKRVNKAVDEIQAKHPGKNILIVGHGGVFQIIEKKELGIASWEDFYGKGYYKRPSNGALKYVYDTTEFKPSNKLDRWIISEINALTKGMTEGLDQYDLLHGLSPLVRFIDSLTNWYIRRSRRRFWKTENDHEKDEAYQTLFIVLVEVCKLLSPFAPFITESMYRNLTGLESVHLSDWPEWHEHRIDEELNQEIDVARQIVALGHAARAKAKRKVRQPLGTIEIALPSAVRRIASQGGDDEQSLQEVIREELNVKDIRFLKSLEGKVKTVVKPNGKLLGPKLGAAVQEVIREAKNGNFTKLDNGNVQVLEYELTPEEIEVGYEALEEGEGRLSVEAGGGIVVILDTAISPELEREGFARDIVRGIQSLRKDADLNVSDRIRVSISADAEQIQKAIVEFQDYIRKETLAAEILPGRLQSQWETVLNLGEHGVVVAIEKA